MSGWLESRIHYINLTTTGVICTFLLKVLVVAENETKRNERLIVNNNCPHKMIILLWGIQNVVIVFFYETKHFYFEIYFKCDSIN